MRITKNPEERKKEIINTSKELFESRGIENTTISQIAESIGVAKGLIYYYFKSKEELVEAVIEDFILGLDGALGKIMANKEEDFYQKLISIFNLYFDFIEGHPKILTYSPGNPGLFTLIRDRLSGIALVHATDLIDQGIKENILKIKYPEYMLEIIIKGLGDLYIKGVIDPKIHTILAEQLLGLEEKSLNM